LSSTRSRTKGALDLGGASTEITFEPEKLPVVSPEYLSLMMYGSNYTIYAGSYLCYGLNEGYRQYLADLVLVSTGFSIKMVFLLYSAIICSIYGV